MIIYNANSKTNLKSMLGFHFTVCLFPAVDVISNLVGIKQVKYMIV